MNNLKYKTREEWLRQAIVLVNEKIFNNSLNLIDHQIGCALLKGDALGDTVFPYEGEDVSLDDFFPPTIHIDEKIKEPAEMIMVLTHECIHAFMNIKNHKKQFAAAASKIGFEKPFTRLHANEVLAARCRDIAKELGDFPGKPIVPRKKEKKKKTFSGKIFCPECGNEYRVSEKMFKKHNQALPVCPCGCKMALDCIEEESSDGQE